VTPTLTKEAIMNYPIPYVLSILSKHPEFKDKTLIPYGIDDERVVGVFGDEPYAVRLDNCSYDRIEVRISIDGPDILTGEPATTLATGKRWVVEPRGTLLLETWPETQQGGARFLFADSKSSVAVHTRGDARDVGVIAAAVFKETPVREQYTGGRMTKGITRGGPRGSSSVRTQSVEASFKQSRDLAGATMDSRSIAGTGAGVYAEQRITQVAGLRNPVLAEVLRLRYLWWDTLVSKLKEKGISPSAVSGFPGFPGNKPFKGIDLGSTPRETTPAAVTEYQRVTV
jgi:hypothetical protein